MPVVFREGGVRFLFYADEGDPLEPVHVHALAGGKEAKFWIGPVVELARSKGFKPHEVRRIEAVVIERRDEITEAWNDFFGI